MANASTGVYETGWYFPGALDPGEQIPPLPGEAAPYMDADDMVRLIEEGIAVVEKEANAQEPSPLTAAMDIVDKKHR